VKEDGWIVFFVLVFAVGSLLLSLIVFFEFIEPGVCPYLQHPFSCTVFAITEYRLHLTAITVAIVVATWLFLRLLLASKRSR
jgi:hypothetical protein